MRKRRAFSLVELSIVLVILGLLVGGVLSGQSLIRAAELRAVTSEYSRYYTAVQSFRDKYFAIPGDFSTATAFWGKDNTNCAGNTGTAATPGTCNGNGNGTIDYGGANNATGEIFQFWKQLALAGLIEGNYTGLSGPLAGCHGDLDSIAGTNIPKSKASNAAWGDEGVGNIGGDGGIYAMNYGNVFLVGSVNSGCASLNPFLKPEEAWNIDTKMDDGKPATGKVTVRSATYAWTNPAACTTSTANTDFTGAYNLSSSTLACSLYFPKVF